MKVAVAFVFALMGGAAFAQSPRVMTDLESRQTLLTGLSVVNQPDPLNPTQFSYVARVDTTETVGSLVTTTVGVLRYFSDESTTAYQNRAELTSYRGSTLVQRVVADGRRVWNFNPLQNEYSVSAYDSERAPRSGTYRKDFVNFFRASSQSATSTLITLAMQAGLAGSVGVKDWIGGVPFQGEESPNGIQRTVWQAVPGNSRYVRFDLTSSLTLGWVIQQIRIYRTENVAGLVRTTDSVITFPPDALGLPMRQTAASAEFRFIPPAGSKVIASPRNF